MKKHGGFILFFSVLIFVFLKDIILLKASFIGGDSRVQFYPWMSLYAQALHDGHLPFWTSLFHAGFPLMAEGQIGGFSPVNLLFFLLLPFKMAYNYSFVFHFIIAGIGVYLCARKLGANQWGGALSALVFCFGSTYAGCFYNIITLKTLAWCGFVVLFLEYFLSTQKWIFVFLAGIVCGIQFLAGFFQMAFYACALYLLYLCYGLWLIRARKKSAFVAVTTFFITAVIIALPQVLLSWPLTMLSGRTQASLDFALWKSFMPPMVISLVFPYWIKIMGGEIYLGILSLFFIIYTLCTLASSRAIRPLVVLGGISFLGALGRYNPLYVLLLKITHLYSFRNPSKLLFFTLFAGSILAGIGFSLWDKKENTSLMKRACLIFFSLISGFFLIFLLAKIVLPLCKPFCMQWLHHYIQQHVVGQPFHRHALAAYFQKADGLFTSLITTADLHNIFTITSCILVCLSLGFAAWMYFRPPKMRILTPLCLSIIFIDLFVYSFYGTGFRPNIKSFAHVEPTHLKLLHIIQSDPGLYRMMPFDLRDPHLPFWAIPNSNILVNIPSIAAYTPLAMTHYTRTLSSLEIIDESLGLLIPSDRALEAHLTHMRLLNVKYIITSRILPYSFLEKKSEEDGIFLYVLRDPFPRIFFSPHSTLFNKETMVAPQSVLYQNGRAEVHITVPTDGFIIFSENYDPKWHVWIDGKEQPLLCIENLVQGVRVLQGTHHCVFAYKPCSPFPQKPIENS